MRKSLLRAWALIAVVCIAVPAWSQEFTALTGWDEQLYPSFVISTATVKEAPWIDTERTDIVGERTGLLGVRVKSPGKNATIKVTLTCDDVMDSSTFSGTLPEEGVEYTVYPKIKYHYAKLADVTQATPVSVTYQVQIGKGKPTEQTATVTVRPINDCPFTVSVGEDSIDISSTFAAYVNEQHPYLDKVLREALDQGIVDSFSGYQGDEAEVVKQVYALWDTLVARDVRYSSITATSVSGQTVSSQHVRLIDESLNNSQANCVDGSVLFASLLRKIGIEPFLVMVPGHCYVGFYLDEEQKTMLALETTMLGSSVAEGEEYAAVEVLQNSVDEELRNENSWASFSNAIATGSKNFEESKEKFDDPDDSDYLVIGIAEARQQGVLPIAFRGKEKFNNLKPGTTDSTDAPETNKAESSDDEE